MKTYPYTAWTFGTKSCTAHEVVLVGAHASGRFEFDAMDNAYTPDEIFETKRQALSGAEAYLDRKQQEIDKRQSGINERRHYLQQQRSVTK